MQVRNVGTYCKLRNCMYIFKCCDFRTVSGLALPESTTVSAKNGKKSARTRRKTRYDSRETTTNGRRKNKIKTAGKVFRTKYRQSFYTNILLRDTYLPSYFFQAELAKAEMDKEEKMQRMIELRQKRKREKIENIRKKQYAARLRALIVMADLHHEKSLLSKYGIRPFKILLEMKRDNIEKAKVHYLFQLKNSVFLHWLWYTEDMWYERNFIADEFRRKSLLRKAVVGFKLVRQFEVMRI